MWGPLVTSWLERAQGNTAEALRWIDEARKLDPADTWTADQKIDLLFTLDNPDATNGSVQLIEVPPPEPAS